MKICSWCFNIIGKESSVEQEVKGEKKHFHNGFFKNCLKKWQKDQKRKHKTLDFPGW